ncbi:transposase [Piscinibacter koreensis]|uniref:transposase n=1 Tax=Piscinibacter koreensis TaxID=2742824 RepID=UPI002174EA6E|nr:transposase [Schlegelella koreensis]
MSLEDAQAEAGLAVETICRESGFSGATFYKWRAKFGCWEASDAKRMRAAASATRSERQRPGRRRPRPAVRGWSESWRRHRRCVCGRA